MARKLAAVETVTVVLGGMSRRGAVARWQKPRCRLYWRQQIGLFE